MAALLFVSLMLFFPNLVSDWVDKVFVEDREVFKPINTFRIAFAIDVDNFEPTSDMPAVRQRTVNIYESLVRLDRDFNPRTSLAIAWGLKDDRTWNIKLRPDVYFHDGSSFDAQDVEASFERAKNYSESELTDLFDAVESVNVIADNELDFITSEPDPLFVQKLSRLLIIPSENEKEKIDLPIGTAVYKYDSYADGVLKLSAFENYWGSSAVFDNVQILSITDANERVDALSFLDIDFLAFVPHSSVTYFDQLGYEVSIVPSLQVQYLLFNQKSKYFESEKNKKLIFDLIDREAMRKYLNALIKNSTQFVGNGVFGYNSDVDLNDVDFKALKTQILESDLKGQHIKLVLANGLDTFANYLVQEFKSMGIFLDFNSYDSDEYVDILKSADWDLALMAYRSNTGDALNFYSNNVLTGADENYAYYSVEDVDDLIVKSLVNMDEKSRLKDMKEIQRILVEKNIYGVPLFEYETVYAYVKALIYEPRLDGIIYIDEIKQKNEI